MDAATLRSYMGTKFVGVSTCFVCHDGNGRIYMAKRSHDSRDEKGRWDVGSGALDFGMTAEQNVAKEIQEEYCAVPKELTFLGYRDALRSLDDGTPTHWLALDFLALVDPAEVRIGEPHKFDDSGWFTLGTLPSPLHSMVPLAFEKYRDILAEKVIAAHS